MQASDLIEAFRQRANDVAAVQLFDEVDVLRWASEAEREACIRAKLIFDRTKPTICFINVAPDVTTYTINPLITEVSAVYLERSAQYPGMHRKQLDRVDQSNSRARYRRCRDYGNNYAIGDDFGLGAHVAMYSIDGYALQLYGTPDTTFAPSPAVSFLRLEVYRLPLVDMADPSDEPEIPLMHQDGLVDWMLYRAFTGVDNDENAVQRGVLALQLFEQRYGPRPSANQTRMQAEGRRWQTPYGGIR